MNRAIASTGEDGVAAGGDREACVNGRFLAGAADRQFRVNASGLDDADRKSEFAVAARSLAARVGIKQNRGFAHAPHLALIEFSAELNALRMSSRSQRGVGFGAIALFAGQCGIHATKEFIVL